MNNADGGTPKYVPWLWPAVGTSTISRPCAEVAQALVHFALVADLLLSLFRWQTRAKGPLASLPHAIVPEVELAVDVGHAYALLTGGEVVAILLDHADAWHHNRSRILAALRLNERRLDTS